MSVFADNVRALEIVHPRFTEEIVKRYIPANDELEVLSARDGSPTARYRGAMLHSRHAPRKEADRLIEASIRRDADCCIVYGFGLGYHVESAIKKLPEVPVVVVEPDVPLFLATLRVRDLTGLFRQPRISFLLGTAPQSVSHVLADLNPESLFLVAPQSMKNVSPKYFQALDEELSRFVSRKSINTGTLSRFGKTWVRNFSQNIALLPHVIGVSHLYGAFRGIPAIVVAAGPSLDDTAPQLPDLARHALVIAVDTSLRACLRAGVQPDLLVTVDPQYWNTRHLDWCPTYNLRLVSESSTHPNVFKREYASVYFCDSLFPIGSMVERAVGSLGQLGAGGSVATSAWDLARRMGCGPIYMMGLDLGFPRLQTHYAGSFFEELIMLISARTDPSEGRVFSYLYEAGPSLQPDNSGEQVLTDKRLLIYKWWFENQMLQHPTVDTVTLSTHGVSIPGMRPASTDEIRRHDSHRSSIDTVFEAQQGYPSSDAADRRKALKSAAEALLSRLEQLERRARGARGHISQLAHSPGTSSVTAERLRILDAVDREIISDENRDVAGFLMQDDAQQILSTRREHTSTAEILNDSERFYTAFEKAARFNIHHLRRALRRL